MAEPLRIRFATDTAGVKSGMQDLAATVLSGMIKVSGAVATHSESAGAAATKLGDAFGTGAQGVAKAATTIVRDIGTVGAAGLKAANDSNFSGVAIGTALGKAASSTTTASVAAQAGFAALSAKAAFTFGVIKNEVSQTASLLAASPMFMSALPIAVALGSLVAGFALTTAAADAAKASVEEYVKIATKARDLGVDSSFLQRWTAQAKELNIEVAKLEAMLAHARDAATIKIGEGENGATSAVGDRLEQNVRAGNLSAGDKARFTAADGTEAQYRVILDLIQQLQAKGAQLAALDLAGKMFGADFERQLRSGVDMVSKMKETLDSTAQSVGGTRIISQNELLNAQAIDAQLLRIQTIMGEGFAPIQRDLVTLGQESYRSWLDIEEAIAKAVRTASGLYTEVSKILAKIDEITGKNPLGSLATALGATGIRNGLGIAEPDGPENGPAIPPGGIRVRVNPKTDTSRSLPSLSGKKEGAGSKDEIERLIDQLGKANEVAKAELETVGLGNIEREKALGLAKLTAAAKAAGREATDEETESVKRLAEATGQFKAKTMDAQQALRENAEAMREFGQLGADAFAGMVLEGKSFDDVLSNLTKTLARFLIQAAFTGQGPLAGVLGLSAAASAGPNASGGLIGLISSGISAIGKNAEGTDNWRGGLSWVGEKGPELVNLPRGAQVIPNAIASRGGGGTVLTMGAIHIDARGSTMSHGEMRAIVDAATQRSAAELKGHIANLRGRGAL